MEADPKLVFYITENLYLKKQNYNLKLLLFGIGVYWLYKRGKALETRNYG